MTWRLLDDSHFRKVFDVLSPNLSVSIIEHELVRARFRCIHLQFMISKSSFSKHVQWFPIECFESEMMLLLLANRFLLFTGYSLIIWDAYFLVKVSINYWLRWFNNYSINLANQPTSPSSGTYTVCSLHLGWTTSSSSCSATPSLPSPARSTEKPTSPESTWQ